METRANYALIGAFTLAAAFATFLFPLYWFSGPSQLGRQETYQIVFTGAVSGLTRGSSVLFNGVKVGEVTHLGISEQDPSKVDVLVRIDSRTPVKTDTRARLETRGFTGVSDVLLVGGTHGAPPLTAQNDQKYPQIQAERSEFQNLLGNVQNLSTRSRRTPHQTRQADRREWSGDHGDAPKRRESQQDLLTTPRRSQASSATPPMSRNR